MIQTDFLIIGQGIAGTLLSHELLRIGKKVCVIDKPNPHKSSLVAGAVLNPMAGKHWSPSPQAHLFLPKAVEVYQQMEAELDISILEAIDMKVFHEDEVGKIQFEKQRNMYPSYFEKTITEDTDFFRPALGYGTIKGLYKVDAHYLLEGWAQYLKNKDALITSDFDWMALEIFSNRIIYQNIEATKIIFCTGATAMAQPFFQQLPFTKNRGEALIVSIPELPANSIYHKHIRLVPRHDGLFWCGSNYTWKFENLLPDTNWKNDVAKELKEWLKIPFEIMDHIVAERPTTAGQIPFLGLHPKHNMVAIFNGLGTRGFSAGPYWAHALAKQLLDPQCKIENYNQTWFDNWF